jgi:hypothetical protein
MAKKHRIPNSQQDEDLGNMIQDIYCGSRIRIFPKPDPGVKKGSGNRIRSKTDIAAVTLQNHKFFFNMLRPFVPLLSQ